MKGEFLLGSGDSFLEANIYADKSAIVLDWLLMVGIERESFSLREVARDREVSVGLVQRIFGTLVNQGFLKTEGVRTAKRFSLIKPKALLSRWLEHYNIVKKCKMRTYHSGLENKREILELLKRDEFKSKVALALHSAAEVHKCKNTNLNTVELYIFEPNLRKEIEGLLELEPQERGYEVLLIEPYYRSLLKREEDRDGEIRKSSPLLTLLDLYHFPLRGHEQAEFMIERISELKRIYKRD